MGKKFDDFRFAGLNRINFSNKYYQMDRVNDDETKIVVKVADVHIRETRYGWMLILDAHHVAFLKDWAVDRNYYGNEVLLDKEYFKVKEWGDFSDDFFDEPENCSWDHYLMVAKEQQGAQNYARWTR